MKRLGVFVLVLLLLAGAVVGVGYVPFRMEPDGVYVMYSTTSGWEDTPFSTTGFLWRWELLIPRNAELYRFDATPRRVTISSRSVLPSADLYSNYLEGQPSFRTVVEVAVRYSLLPEALPELAADGLRPENFDTWVTDMELQLKNTVIQTVGTSLQHIADSETETAVFPYIQETVFESLANRFPNIIVDAVVPERIEVPDLQLYRTARESYFSVQRSRTQALQQFVANQATQEAADNRKVEILRQYGEVLNQYPVLIDYLRTGSGELAEALDRALSSPLQTPQQETQD